MIQKRTKKYKVNVTSTHIRKGIANIKTGNKCILALAIRAAFKVKDVTVGYDNCARVKHRYFDGDAASAYALLTIKTYENKPELLLKKIKPFTFTLTLS